MVVNRAIANVATTEVWNESLTELMKQPQYAPLTNAEIVAVIFAGTKGFLDALPVKDVARFEQGLLAHLRGARKDILDWLTKDDPKIKGEAEGKLKAAIEEFAKTFA